MQFSIVGEHGKPGVSFGNANGVIGFNSIGIVAPDIVPFHQIEMLEDYVAQMKMGSERLFRKSYYQAFFTQLSHLLMKKNEEAQANT